MITWKWKRLWEIVRLRGFLGLGFFPNSSDLLFGGVKEKKKKQWNAEREREKTMRLEWKRLEETEKDFDFVIASVFSIPGFALATVYCFSYKFSLLFLFRYVVVCFKLDLDLQQLVTFYVVQKLRRKD